jgi:dTDP-4-dehydrorhamnose 3,5-epimerase
MPFTFTPCTLPDVIHIKPQSFGDERGFFLETFKASAFADAGITEHFAQDNHSYSTRGVLRGLHFQLPPHAQGKLVSVLSGEVWDVAVDVRKASETFGRWVGVLLSGANHESLYIPPGFAHGFLVLSEYAHFVYKCTREYHKDSERGVRWDDPDVAIQWPSTNVVLSDKDLVLPLLKDAKVFP